MVIHVQRKNSKSTMKKIYETPELMIANLKPVHIMAGSPDYNPNRTTTATSGNLGKQGFGGWDDDVEPGEDY